MDASAGLHLSVSDPGSAVATAALNLTAEIFRYAGIVRATASDAAKDMQDQITNQAYWDLRDILQRVKLVGPPRPWPVLPIREEKQPEEKP